MKGALRGVTVLDMTRLTPGAFATLLLKDLGASVLKIERPGTGDYLRTLVPGAFDALCRGKRSATVDLKRPEGRLLFMELARQADVLVESFRPGVCERLGIGYNALRDVNPRIIMCSLSGYGQSGPLRSRSGHDLNYLGVAGALSLMGRPDGPPEHSTAIAIADFNAATIAAFAIVTALLERQSSGTGQWIDVSMTDAIASWTGRYLMEQLANPDADRQSMMRRPGYSVYETAGGGYITLGCIEDMFWDRLLEIVPQEHPLREYATPQDRAANVDRVEAILRNLFLEHDRSYWLARLEAADIPAGPVNQLGDMLEDPQLRARGVVRDDQLGKRPVVGFPVDMAGVDVTEPAPTLGEHSDETWGALGLTEPELRRFRDEGII